MIFEESYGLLLQERRFCQFATVAAIAGGVSAVAGAAKSVFGGGGSSGGGGSGGYSAPSASITSQALPSQPDSTAAKVYDPTAQMNSWTSIFASLQNSGPNQIIDIPKVDSPATNVSSSQTSPV
jgi:hypothetical protein